jgi:hypothetical protein
MPTTRHRGIVMTQEQLMKVKIKYLEDRLTTMEKSLSRINNILGRFQMTEATGFEDIDKFRDADTMESDHELI